MAKSKEEVTHLRYEPAKGGLVSHMGITTQRGGQGGGPGYDHHEVPTIHPDIEHAKQHLEDTLGHAFMSNDDDEHAGFEGKKQKEEPAPKGGKHK